MTLVLKSNFCLFASTKVFVEEQFGSGIILVIVIVDNSYFLYKGQSATRLFIFI